MTVSRNHQRHLCVNDVTLHISSRIPRNKETNTTHHWHDDVHTQSKGTLMGWRKVISALPPKGHGGSTSQTGGTKSVWPPEIAALTFRTTHWTGQPRPNDGL
uniref:Uncharacterized protein n=1 Tax=Ascaris lumbricoides TaxID=6252 RepID=A0A0M3HS62_ASCLU